MLRKLVLAAVTLALPLATTAATDIPSEVNLHNGYVVVRYHPISHDGPVLWIGEFQGLGIRHGSLLHPGQAFIVTACCTLAGTTNSVQADQQSGIAGRPPIMTSRLEFLPRLCNIRGIPFGYADIEVSASPKHILIVRADTKCPE